MNRRTILLDFMAQLDGQKVNCQDCLGTCCTSKANSMQITPLEAIEILGYLKKSARWNNSLKEKLKRCVSDYRLDIEIATSRGRSFRKTYTCPFFTPGPKGCSLPKDVNPYGCLGFNPKSENSANCSLKEDMASLREEQFKTFELEENKKLKKRYDLNWDKTSIPQALLSLWGKIGI